MATRIPASFRFQSTLMDELKRKAKASNRSLNNYVESLLISVLQPVASDNDSFTPELQTAIRKAIDEHKGGHYVRCSNKQELQSHLDSL